MNGILLLLPVFLPLVLGLLSYFLPIRSESCRRLVYGVLILGTTALAWAAILLCDDGTFTLLHFSHRLTIAFRMDGAARLFAGLSATLWPFTMLYGFDYMRHEKHLHMFWAFFTASFGVTLGIAFAANMMTMYLFYELLTLATSIEGHPDNVAPALLGGLTSSVFEDGVVYSVKRDVDQSLCFAAIVPDYKLLTEAARAALPKQVSHKDAVYNLSRAALVPAAFCEGRHELLAIATEDKLHQPYRMPLMPGSKEAFALAKQCGAKAVYVSGAGSTVMAVAERTDAEEFYKGLEAGLEQLEGLDGCEAFTLLRLDADNTGATVE